MPTPTRTAHPSLSALWSWFHRAAGLYHKNIWSSRIPTHPSKSTCSETRASRVLRSCPSAPPALTQGARSHGDARSSPIARAAYCPASTRSMARPHCIATTSWKCKGHRNCRCGVVRIDSAASPPICYRFVAVSWMNGQQPTRTIRSIGRTSSEPLWCLSHYGVGFLHAGFVHRFMDYESAREMRRSVWFGKGNLEE